MVEHVPIHSVPSIAAKFFKIKADSEDAFVEAYSKDKVTRNQQLNNRQIIAENSTNITIIELDTVKEQLWIPYSNWRLPMSLWNLKGLSGLPLAKN